MDFHLELFNTYHLFVQLFLFLSELQGEGLVGLRKGAVVGISIGSFVLGVLLCMILFYCYRKREARRRRKSNREQCNTFPLKAFENQAYAAAPRKNDNRI